MNLSGKSVARAGALLQDRAGRDPGRRTTSSTCCPARPSSSSAAAHAGHNGLKDIHAQLGSADFWRLRLGIGHPGVKAEVVDYVLRKPSPDQRDAIDKAIEQSLAGARPAARRRDGARDDEGPRASRRGRSRREPRPRRPQRRAPTAADTDEPLDDADADRRAALRRARVRAAAPAHAQTGLPLRQRVLGSAVPDAQRRSRSTRARTDGRRSAPKRRGAARREARWPTSMARDRASARGGAAPALATSLGADAAPRPAEQPRKARSEEAQAPATSERRPRRQSPARAPQAAKRRARRLTAASAGAACRLQPPVLGPAASRAISTCSGSTGMQSTGQTCTHCGSSKWPTHSVQRAGSIT